MSLIPSKLPRLTGSTFPPLEDETRDLVPTDQAAFYLNRRPQTLRCWSCLDTGPIRPVRIFGKLGWPTARIRELIARGA